MGKNIGFNWDFKRTNGPINGDVKGTSIYKLRNFQLPKQHWPTTQGDFIKKSGIEPAQLGDFREDLAI